MTFLQFVYEEVSFFNQQVSFRHWILPERYPFFKAIKTMKLEKATQHLRFAKAVWLLIQIRPTETFV